MFKNLKDKLKGFKKKASEEMEDTGETGKARSGGEVKEPGKGKTAPTPGRKLSRKERIKQKIFTTWIIGL